MVFDHIQWDCIDKCISAAINSYLNRWLFSVSYAKYKRIQDQSFWVNDSLRTRRVKVEADFYETEFATIKITDVIDEAYIHYLDLNTDSDVITPEKLSYNKW